ncbi:MAG: hypothetical protein QM737_21855 [Ferruginibacter sp.]
MSKEQLFKKRKKEYKLFRLGYLVALLFSLLISFGAVFERYGFYKGFSILCDKNHRGLLIFVSAIFVLSLIVTFLLVRWYYKKKDGQNDYLRRKYWP